MKLLNSRPIIYFTIGLLVGGNLSYLFEFNVKYSSEFEVYRLEPLLNLLVHLTIWGVILGGLTVLLSRGIAVVFLTEPKKNAPHQPQPNNADRASKN